MELDHIGVVVQNIQAGIDHWKSLFGYVQKTRPVDNTLQRVKVVFMEKEGSTLIKLIEPLDETSIIFQFARKGGGLHHLCFKISDMDKSIVQLRQKGARLIVPPQTGEAFDNEEIAFLLTTQNLNIELIATDKKTQLITSNL